MSKASLKRVSIILLITMIIPVTLFAHSGRTDSRGGHKDNKNKSGLGSYHYHCGGYPAHLHSDGVCPYKSTGTSSTPNKITNKSSNTKSSTTSVKKTLPKYIEKETAFVINGETVKISTINVNSTNLVELKVLCEKLGIGITYDSVTQSIKCIKGNNSLTLIINSEKYWLNGDVLALNSAPIVYNGRTMVPARVVAESIGKIVTYDQTIDSIVIG